jgi:hypothetical protein
MSQEDEQPIEPLRALRRYEQGYQLPQKLMPRERRIATVRKNDITPYRMALPQELRRVRDVVGQAAGSKLVKQDLESVLEQLRKPKKVKVDNRPPRSREFVPKIGMNDLLKVVLDLKQDVKLIKETQSKAGAETWIRNSGLQDYLYVEDEDLDNDGIPDVVVRDYQTQQPYIVKGFTTTKSNYPLRYGYYTRYPTVAGRKEVPFAQFVDDAFVENYGDGGLSREFNKEGDEGVDALNKMGYGIKMPSKTISVTQAFKRFIIKPVVKAIKDTAKEYNLNIPLSAAAVRQLENTYKFNLIVFPVLANLYGEGILDDQRALNDVWQTKEAKEGYKVYMREFILNRENFIDELATTMLNFLTVNMKIDPELANSFMPAVVERILDSPIFYSKKLPTPIAVRATQ